MDSFKKIEEAETKTCDHAKDTNPQGSDYSMVDQIIDKFKMDQLVVGGPDAYMKFIGLNYVKCLTKHHSDPRQLVLIRDQFEICFLDIDRREFRQAYVSQMSMISFATSSSGLMVLFTEIIHEGRVE